MGAAAMGTALLNPVSVASLSARSLIFTRGGILPRTLITKIRLGKVRLGLVGQDLVGLGWVRLSLAGFGWVRSSRNTHRRTVFWSSLCVRRKKRWSSRGKPRRKLWSTGFLWPAPLSGATLSTRVSREWSMASTTAAAVPAAVPAARKNRHRQAETPTLKKKVEVEKKLINKSLPY